MRNDCYKKFKDIEVSLNIVDDSKNPKPTR
jgi:hypothetical protein